MLNVVILAAGKGTRMQSNKPKVLHTLAGKSFLRHVIDRSLELRADKLFLVVGHGAELIEKEIGSEAGISYVEQKEQLGTGHAVLQVLPHLHADSIVLVLYGDVPLISSATLTRLIRQVDQRSLGLLTVTLDDPHGYGRVIRNQNGEVESVVEQKDADDKQTLITEVNTGVMAVPANDLHRWLPELSDQNAQREYLLPDIIAMARAEGKIIATAQPESVSETLGVNTRAQQAELERIYQSRLAKNYMDGGLTLMDPTRFDCRGSLTFGRDCLIDVNCVFEGEVVLGDRVEVGPNCHIIGSTIGDDAEIKSHSIIECAQLASEVTVGPFARLRPESILGKAAKIGNFVEIKKSTIGKGSKVNHLSYIGDADVGEAVNVGAGTITCNYDGANKFKTTIDDGVFVGSNTALVAPVTLGKNATIAAGSVITSHVKEGELSVARAKQRNVSGWKRPVKKT